MKLKFVFRAPLLAATFAATACSAPDAQAGSFTPTIDAHAALTEAHESYLQQDYPGMVKNLRAALINSGNDALVARNASNLLAAAAAENHDDIPVDWKVPVGMSGVKITQIRRERPSGSVSYKFRVSGNLTVPSSVSQIQVIRYPNEVVLDKQGAVGEWEEASYHAERYFNLVTKNRDETFPEGLYLINIAMAGGESVQGWFILSDTVASRSPTVTQPLAGEVLTTATPTFKWEDFRSPEYKPYESRNATLVVRAVNQAGEWDERWETDFSTTIPTEATVGVGGQGVHALENGPFVMVISFREGRRFGDLRLRRDGSRIVPFTVNVH